MRKISTELAVDLLKRGKAGFYCVQANPPIVHASHYVVIIMHSKEAYLVSSDELTIELTGTVTLGSGQEKMAHTTIVKSEELQGLLLTDIEEHGNSVPQVEALGSGPAVVEVIRKA